MEHPWIKKNFKQDSTEIPPQFDDEVLNRMKQFHGSSKLRKAALRIFVEHVDPKKINLLKKEFQKIDSDANGFLEIGELTEVISKSNIKMTEADIKSIVSQIDFRGDGKISYTEFITATINSKDLLTDERIEAIFLSFDVDNSGKITA